jgi:putative hemolysin
MPVGPFSFDLPPSLLGRVASIAARPLLTRLLGLNALSRTYQAVPEGPHDTFAERVLDTLSVTIDVAPTDLAHIPASGPLIVAANHPRGALDGLALAAIVRRVRPDVRVVANYLLHRIPELRASCFFVDPFGGPAAEARSRAGLRAAHLWLRQGGALIMFPAGEVAHRRTPTGELIEGRWHETIGRLALAGRASVVPAWIDGANSRIFFAAGRLHRTTRTALLPRELLAARNTQVRVELRAPLPPVGAAGELTRRVRDGAARHTDRTTSIQEELRSLPSAARLVDAGRFHVFCAAAGEIPQTLLEIGRLRAITYRAAGEGADSDLDLDPFDRHYLHLFVWDDEARCVVGAYRLGRADVLVNRSGVDALYTRTLFEYGPELIKALSPALELGRSFVRPEYQRNYQALLLLWRGIGAFVVRHPEYRVLFGAVSISARYRDASLSLLTAFLEQNHLDPRLAAMVRPRHPRPQAAAPTPQVPADAAATDRLIARLEGDGKGMPVLLRQYLKLNARAIGVSVDPAFGDVLDALMTIDLTTVSPAILRRYFGDQGLAAYLQHHRAGEFAAA